MRRIPKHKWLATLLASVMLFSMVPMVAGAAGVVTIGDYGFIPNSGEASVSKVDLETGDVMARYYTAPRIGDMVDPAGQPAATANAVPPYAWRTSRIATDQDGNAWVLNVGADAFLTGYPNPVPNYTNSYAYPGSVTSPSRMLQGSVVRIQADTDGLTTNSDHANPLMFGADEAVKVFPVGANGEMPRAITFDAAGNLWVGFYGTGAFQKYSYDEALGTLSPVGDPVMTGGAPYEAKIDKNGILWFSSRAANPAPVGKTIGIGSFDTNAAVPSISYVTIPTPYSLLIDNGDEPGDPVIVYATNLGTNILYKITGGSATSVAITGAAGLRGLSYDKAGKIWMASTNNNSVSWYDPAAGTSGTKLIAAGAVPVGVGADAAGMMWVICRSDATNPGFIAQFDPANLAAGFMSTFVGYRPYAYGDFTRTVELAEIGDFVWNDTNKDGIQDAGESGIEGVTVNLWESDGTESIDTTLTKADGSYLFTDLMPGDYKVEFVAPTGYAFSPQDQGADDAADSDADTTSGMTVGTTLDPGESDMTWDAGLYLDVASLGDFVWNDTNRNGIQDAGEPGIGGVTVKLFACVEGAQGDELASTTTDASGGYMFGGLNAGNYMVEFIAPSGMVFSPADQGADDAVDSDAAVATGLTGCITLSWGENDMTWDAGLNYPIYDICGYKYEYTEGNPGAGWTIKLWKWDAETLDEVTGEPGAYVWVEDALTGADGKYCFSGLYAGDYKVTEVMKDGWMQLAPATPDYHLVTLPAGASDCEAEPQVNMYNFLNDLQRKRFDDTVWAYGGAAATKNNTVAGNSSSAWGWTNYIGAAGTYEYTLYGGAGQNDIAKGSAVGTVTVVYDGVTAVVTYAIDPAMAAANDYKLIEAQLWVGSTQLPKLGTKAATSAPGQFPFAPVISADGLTATYTQAVTAPFWVAAHGVVEWWE